MSIDDIMAQAQAERAAVERALEAGNRRFRDRSMPRASLTVTESVRPDCPEGHVQLTRWDGSMPVGHTYADARGGWAAVAHEVRMQGFSASACVTVETDPPGIMPLAAVEGL